MCKKILTLLLCTLFLLSAGCSAAGTPSDTASDRVSDTASSKPTAAVTDTDPATDEPTDEPKKSDVFDADLEHRVIVSDVQLRGLLVLDMDLCETWEDLSRPEILMWEWDPEKVDSCKKKTYIGEGIDEAKLRYSECFDCDVVISCSSAGWLGVIDYETKEVLWEDVLQQNLHSLEMLPNGDLIVACAGTTDDNGALVYYPLSAGQTTVSSSLSLPFAHGVCWDPDRECVWALGFHGVIGVKIEGYGTSNAKLTQIEGAGAEFPVEDPAKNPDYYGHDLSPMYGTPGKYWVSAAEGVWVFDAEQGVLNKDYAAVDEVSTKEVKGIASFADNTMVLTVASGDTGEASRNFATHYLKVVTLQPSEDPETPTVTVDRVRFDKREFYKVHTFSKNYN